MLTLYKKMVALCYGQTEVHQYINCQQGKIDITAKCTLAELFCPK
jgi:hypothetical protein